MRFIAAFMVASLLAFLAFWGAAWIAEVVDQPDREYNDFTIGDKMMLCGRVVDTRHMLSGYDFDDWQGARCESLSKLDECLLDCLARAGTLDMGALCYPNCVEK